MSVKRYGRGVIVLTICLSLMGFLQAPEALSTELSLTGGTVATGESFTVTVTVDAVEGLAGLKVIIDYDPAIITYRGGARTSHTGSMMHVVNDRNPGRLILVMAAATGISGENLPLFTFTFEARNNAAGARETALTIRELELMSETLKKIEASSQRATIVITDPEPR